MTTPPAPPDATTTLSAVIAALASVGINPAGMAAGLVGVIIFQSLLTPREPLTTKGLAWRIVGSVLFASAVAPVISSLIATWWTRINPVATPQELEALRALVAIGLGGLAQPLLLITRSGVLRFWAGRFPKSGDSQ